jgi:hypothetical protein
MTLVHNSATQQLSNPATQQPEGRWKNMTSRKIAFAVAAWVVLITAAHMTANVDWTVLLNERLPEGERKLNVAFIPVT